MSIEGKQGRLAVLSSAGSGGAGVAARRIADAMVRLPGWEVDFIDRSFIGKVSDDIAPQHHFGNNRETDTHFTVEYPGHVRGWLLGMLDEYDYLNIHWTTYLLTLAELNALSRSGKPMLFTLHDYHFMTGGCHYPAGCEGFHATCAPCPQLDRRRAPAAPISRNLELKREIFSRPNVHLAAPSRFLVDEAVASGIVPRDRAHVLRNAYFPVKGIHFAHQQRPLRIILIADSLWERRKGMMLAIESLAEAARRLRSRSNAEFLVDVVGNANGELRQRLASTGIRYKLHGRISNHARLAALYGSADHVLTCSSEDNWPNILVEAGAYGCFPIVGPGHGCEEFVRWFNAGIVTNDYTRESFAGAIMDALLRTPLDNRLTLADIVRVEHAPSVIAEQYATHLSAIAGTQAGSSSASSPGTIFNESPVNS